MSQFYASIQGSRGPATRQGTKSSGISGHIRGWNVGIQVYGYVNIEGKDVFGVMLTSGSNGHKDKVHLGYFTEADLGKNSQERNPKEIKVATILPPTKYEYTILGNYGQGWEPLSTYDDFEEAKADLIAYNENEPQYAHKITRQPI